MKTISIFITSVLMVCSFSTFASTGSINCKVTSLHAIENDDDLYGTVKCESGSLAILARSESVKAILLASKVSDKSLNISVSTDNAFQKNGTLNTVERVELN